MMKGGEWGVSADSRLIMSFVRVAAVTSTIDTLFDTSFPLPKEPFPRLGVGLVDENPARNSLWVIWGYRLERRLIQFKGDVANVVRASGREVGLSLCHGTGTDAHLPNPPTKYIAWISQHQCKAKISINYQNHRPRT